MKRSDMKNAKDSAEAFEKAVSKSASAHYSLRLYVAGTTPNSMRAITNLKRICEEHLANRYELEIIDIYQQPELTQEAQVVAAPTLFKQLPTPIRQIIGDLSNEERVLIGLDLKERTGKQSS